MPPPPYGPLPAYPYGWPSPYGQPPGYPPPIPYYVPPPPPPGRKTFEALDKFTRATTFAIYANVVIALFGLATLALLFTGGLLGAAVASSGGGLVANILQLVAFVYGLMGVSAFKDGRTEFGPQHEGSVDRGWRLLIGAVVVYVGGIVVTAIVVVVGIFSSIPQAGGTPDPAAFGRSYQQLMIATAVIAVVGVYVLALCLQAFVEKLMRHQGRDSRAMFIVLSLAAAVTSGALLVLSAFMFPLAFPQAGQPLEATAAVNFAPIAALLSIVALLVYKRQLGEAVAGARAMIESRTFDPDAAPGAAGVAAPMPPPSYPG